MPHPFLSEAWLKETRQLADASPEFQQVAKDLTTSLLNVVTNTPSGQDLYLYYRFNQGAIEELRRDVGATKAAQPPEFKATATYETFALINQGKLSTTAAVFGRKIKLEGNLAKALRFSKPLEVFNALARKVPTVY